jgi:hypothetical protein
MIVHWEHYHQNWLVMLLFFVQIVVDGQLLMDLNQIQILDETKKKFFIMISKESLADFNHTFIIT